MKSCLLFPDHSFDWSQPPPWNSGALEFDLSLHTLFQTMAHDDPLILASAKKVILAAGDGNRDIILYRQSMVQDCLQQRQVIEEFYAIANQAMEKHWSGYLGSLSKYPHWVLDDAVKQMEILGSLLGKLRHAIDAHGHRFRAEGWQAFFNRARRELSDNYFREMIVHLRELKLDGGMLMSARFDSHGSLSGFMLHRYRTKPRSLWQRFWEWIFPPLLSPNSFAIHPRDEAGARALQQLRDEGIAFAAVALAHSRDRVREFFEDFRSELAFYLGCMNLHDALKKKGASICYPVPSAPELLTFNVQDLCDVSLVLHAPGRVIGTSADAEQKRLILVTGANQGGKSTFLRSAGLAQLMMQSGMFVGAKAYSASICRGLYTHYKREESAALESGKFDEELSRMSEIIDRLSPYSLVLFNESFAATNEREGSEIGLQILTGLMEQNVRAVCVTHLYDLAHRLYQERKPDVLFLQPERKANGTRTFRLFEGEPLPTSHGVDLYALLI
jgi:DNA mismatch repair ATPase MutS